MQIYPGIQALASLTLLPRSKARKRLYSASMSSWSTVKQDSSRIRASEQSNVGYVSSCLAHTLHHLAYDLCQGGASEREVLLCGVMQASAHLLDQGRLANHMCTWNPSFAVI